MLNHHHVRDQPHLPGGQVLGVKECLQLLVSVGIGTFSIRHGYYQSYRTTPKALDSNHLAQAVYSTGVSLTIFLVLNSDLE